MEIDKVSLYHEMKKLEVIKPERKRTTFKLSIGRKEDDVASSVGSKRSKKTVGNESY